MTSDEELEALVRESMRGHEHLAEGAGARLLPAVRASVRQRPRRAAWVAAVAGVALAAGAIPVGIALFADNGGTSVPPSAGGSPPPEGWRWESSRGLQIAVPPHWAVNDFGCNMTDGPTVVRGSTAEDGCLTPEARSKEVAILAQLGDGVTEEVLLQQASLESAPREEVEVDGVPAILVSGRVADGRHAAAVLVPDRGAAVIVRTRAAETTNAIIASLRVVDVDHAGCSWRRPPVTNSARDGEFMDLAPASVSVCWYASYTRPTGGELLASGQLTGDAATQLAGLVNAAPPGPNPDAPASQCAGQPQPADVVLHVHGQDGTVHDLWISFTGCLGRGVTDGANTVQVTRRIVSAVMDPLRVGYGFAGGLPE